MASPAFTKDFKQLQESISSFTHGEARIIDFDDKVPSFKVELHCKNGFHRGGRFIFQVFLDKLYPRGHKKVKFLTRILHPAVNDDDIEILNYGIGYWHDYCATLEVLEEIVQDVYYQIKYPVFDSVLNPLFFDDLSVNDQDALRAKFAEDVRMSLKVDEIFEEMNAVGKNVVKPKRILLELATG